MTGQPQVTGLVLAGGRAQRMGGVDKGLQPLGDRPMVAHVLQRLAAQVHSVLINANRNLATYQGLGPAVVPDLADDFQGPLAGVLAALPHCHTPWLITVPCDTPFFPADLVATLLNAAQAAGADAAMPVTTDDSGHTQRQPVFLLLRASLHDHLHHYLQGGGRKIDTWTNQLRCELVPFADPQAFFNANTPHELAELRARAA
ncbi:MAG: molybdenum cofactor guanylyltransferase MobA [Burkholderiaceae bacterium]